MRCTSACARARVNTRARLELHLAFQRGLVDLAVALEGHLVDDGVLDHRDEDAGAVAIDAHVREQAGGEQRLDGLVDFARIVGIADVELEVGADRLRLDAAVAGHADVADRAACACSGWRGDQHRLDERPAQRAPPSRPGWSASPPTCTFPCKAFVPSAFQFAVPSSALPVGVGWALRTRCSCNRRYGRGNRAPSPLSLPAGAFRRPAICLTVQ